MIAEILRDARLNTEDQNRTVITKLTTTKPLERLACLMTPGGVMKVEECAAELEENGHIDAVFWLQDNCLMWHY